MHISMIDCQEGKSEFFVQFSDNSFLLLNKQKFNNLPIVKLLDLKFLMDQGYTLDQALKEVI